MKKQILIVNLLLSFTFYNLFAQCPPPGFPQTGDTCPQAGTLCQDINGYCDTLGTNNVVSNFPGCPANVLNNDEWFSFIAGSTTIDLLITPSACQGLNGQFGIHGAIVEGTCTGPAIATQCPCTENPFNLMSTNFQIGQTYYVVFDGCAGDICAFDVTVIQGSTVPVPPADPTPISGPLTVCPGATTNYSIPITSAEPYVWTLSPPIGSFMGANNGSNVGIMWNTVGTAQLCVQGSNDCGFVSAEVCITINSQNIPPTDEFVEGCLFDEVICAGQPIVVTSVNEVVVPVIMDSYLGCDSLVNCHVSGIEVAPTDLGQVDFCGFTSYEICGNFFSESGIYVATCTNYQGCDSLVNVDLAIMDPDAEIATPIPVLDCGVNSVVVLDGSPSSFNLVPGGNTTFSWSGPGIVGPNNDVVVQVNQPGQYCLTVTHERNGVECEDTQCVTVMQDTQVPQAPDISGDDTPCQGDNTQYTANPVGSPPPDGYTWTTPNGEPIIPLGPNSIEVVWNSTLGGELCVTADNGCGSSPPTCITITVTEQAEDPVLDGPDEVCANNQTQTYTVTNVQPGVTYSWTVPAGASFSGSGSSINVNFNGATPGTAQVCVIADNDCGESDPGCVTVTISELPVPPTLTGPTTVCSNGTGYTYEVTNAQAGDNYLWTAPPGATINGTGSSVTIDFNGATTGQVCVASANDCDTTQQVCQAVTVIQAPTATISGSGSYCEGTTDSVDLTIELTGTGPWDVTYTLNGANPTTITINNSPFTLTVGDEGTYELTTLSGSGNCDGSVSGSAEVIEDPAPTAQIDGTVSICQGSGEQAELIIDLTGTAPWTVEWEVNNNAQAPLVINNNPYTLNIGQSQAGDITLISVIDGNGCPGTATGTAVVTVNTAPTVSGISTDCDATNTNYTVTFTINGGDPATYSVTPNTGTLNGNVFTSDLILSGDGYSFVVSDANDCNPVTVDDNTVICNCTSAAGDTEQTPVEECGDGPVTIPYDDTDEFFDGDDVLMFILHSGSGINIVQPIVGEYTTPEVSFDPATMTYGTTYYLSAVVGSASGNSVDLDDPCLSVSQGTPVTFYEVPTATLSGNPSICEGDPASLTVDFTGSPPWSISYDDGSGNVQMVNGITNNPYTLVVTPDTSGLTTYCLTAMSDDNCPGDQTGCADVTVNTGVTYDSLEITCNSTATAYVITFNISGGDPASYVVTGVNGTIQNGVFTSEEIPTGSGYSLVLDDANSCDPQNISQSQIICNCETDAGTMDPIVPVEECGDGPVTVTAATGIQLDGDDIALYYLHTSSSDVLGTVIAINTDPTFSYDPATMEYGETYYISSVVGSDDGAGGIDLTDPCLDVTVGVPVTFYEVPTATILGGTEICPGESADLTIELTGDSPWSVTINGQDIDNIQGSPYTYTVDPAATTTYQLTAVSDENCDNVVVDSQTVVVHDPPVAINIDEECNLTATAYTVTFEISGGDATCYDVSPANGTITGNTFTSNEIPTGQAYNFALSDCFGCPDDVVAAPAPNCDCTSEAGDMDATPVSVCGNQPAEPVYLGGEVLDPDDELCFVLRDEDNNVIATNPDEPSFTYNQVTMTYGVTYFVCAVVGNDNGNGCVDLGDNCTDFGACTEVVFHVRPTATLSGTTSICANESTDLQFNLTGVGPWTIVYQNAAGNQFTETTNNSPFILPVTPATSTAYSLVSIDDANCDGTVSGNAAITVNTPPSVASITEDCDSVGLTYTVSFNIVGGNAASYAVDPPGSIVGNVYTSAPILSGDSYIFLVDDANECGPFEVEGIHACNCTTDAGSMLISNPLELCIGETATATFNNNEVLDPNDALVFVLHTNPSNQLGTILATNPNGPVFDFDPANMTPGVTYYISSIAGNDDGAGGVNQQDPCFDIAPGVAVTFFENPTIAIDAPTSVCEGEIVTITLSVTGNAPFNVTYDQDGTTQTIPVANTGGFDIDLFPVATTTITILNITDDNGCESNPNETYTVIVNPDVEAGTAIGDLTYCENDNQPVILDDQLAGADPGGTWTDQNGQAVPGGSVNVNSLQAGNYVFTYTVEGIGGCPDDEESFTLIVNPQPVADAGPTQVLDCDILSVQIGGPNTTPNVNYEWTGGNVSDPNIPNPTVEEPGIYTLTVTNDFGCFDSDQVEVEQNVGIPDPVILSSDVRCYGDENGFIVVESVSGGIPPYLYSLNNGPFTDNQSFTGLAPGVYTLTVEDVAGCESTEDIVIAEPPEVVAEIQANFPDPDKEGEIELGESLMLDLISVPAPGVLDTIIWSPPGVDSACVGCPGITVQPVQQTTYTVEIDENGCRATYQLTVAVRKDFKVYVPNAFSPNDDGINDFLLVYSDEDVAEIKSFLVFSRWGEAVHEFYKFQPAPFNLEHGWDGKHHGDFLNPGVYTYFVEVLYIDGQVELLEGSVHLMR